MFLFIHIPRTAGTTFSSILRRNFKDKYVRIYGMKKIDFFSDEEVKALAVFFPEAECISAHKFVCPIPQPDNSNTNKIINFQLITFLREPVERSLSHYFFQKKQVERGVKKDFTDLDFGQYFDKVKEKDLIISRGKWASQANMQAYVLDRNFNLEKAKKRMKEEFFFIGVSERFDESLVVLKKKMKEEGIDFKINYFPRNISKKRKKAKDILSPEVYNKVLLNNDLDKELWNFANYLLDKEIEKYGPEFKRDLTKFQRKQKILAKFALPAKLLGKIARYKIKKVNDWFGWL